MTLSALLHVPNILKLDKRHHSVCHAALVDCRPSRRSGLPNEIDMHFFFHSLTIYERQMPWLLLFYSIEPIKLTTCSNVKQTELKHTNQINYTLQDFQCLSNVIAYKICRIEWEGEKKLTRNGEKKQPHTHRRSIGCAFTLIQLQSPFRPRIGGVGQEINL